MAYSPVTPDHEPRFEDLWRSRARELRKRYLDAHPYSHLVDHDLFPRDLVLSAEMEELPRALTLPIHSSHRERRADSSSVAGSAAGRLLAMMKSPEFVEFVEEVTQIPDLQTDDTNLWGGLHVNRRGCFRALHRDFTVNPLTNKWHRVNAILFLNSNWEEEYRGDLELWGSDLQHSGARIKPDAGTLVLFESCGDNIHGVPDRITCPSDRARLSLAVHYYSDQPPTEMPGRSSFLRPRRPQDPWWVSLPEWLELVKIVMAPLEKRIPAVAHRTNALRSARAQRT
jgi:hypothetical protein